MPCTRARWPRGCRRPPAGKRPILLRLESQAGHGAGKPLAKIIAQYTDELAFLFAQLGMSANPS